MCEQILFLITMWQLGQWLLPLVEGLNGTDMSCSLRKILKRYLSKSLSAVSHNIKVKSKNMS